MSADLKVYVVDDHKAVRDSLQALLVSAGWNAQTFASGDEFLAAFDPSSRGCLLLDLRLPDINGIDLQKRLTEQGSKLRTVMISGHGDVPMAVMAMKAGAVDFIEKPYTDDVILKCVEQNLAQSRHATEAAGSAEEIFDRIEQLTLREREVLEALLNGHANKMIAYRLGISPRTVEIHRARVMTKMEAKSLPHLIRMALTAGVSIESP